MVTEQDNEDQATQTFTYEGDQQPQNPEVHPSPTPDSDSVCEPPQLVLPFESMSAQERFQATTRLLFVAPDVPPVQPRPARGQLRQLDEILDQRFAYDDTEHEPYEGSHRRTRRRSESGAPGTQDPPRRQTRQAPVVTEPQKVKGSTRLEAKKQRRRDGRDQNRRRMVITESEFLARRESVDREMIVRTAGDRVQIGVTEDKVLVEHYVARSRENSLIGNVYLGSVQNVLPSMEAAFVDIGRGRNAVLYSGEVDWSEFDGGNTARRIENALKPGDKVLVQVSKDPVGHKGARLTSQISLPGRFLVYVPGGAVNGISRKLPDTERVRLKKILKRVLPSDAGVIVRTAAEGASEAQLTHDVERLTRQWEAIQARAAEGTAPVMLHSEPDMLIKIVRDVFNEDFKRFTISGTHTYEVIETYLSEVAPELMGRVEHYEGEREIFDQYRVSEQISKALDRKVWLPSGGSLVIDRTEAMTVVDVNTGKFVGSGGNLEETVTMNNLEAAEEIVRQLRLRDIGGIIVIDFIDMVLESNRDLVLRRLVECLGRDRTKHQVAEVTSLGLVQMTRKKLGLGLLESFSEPCDECAGRGLIVDQDPVFKHRENSQHSQRGRGNKNGAHQRQDLRTHPNAITDGAKNMLAEVAASTIANAKAAELKQADPVLADPESADPQSTTFQETQESEHPAHTGIAKPSFDAYETEPAEYETQELQVFTGKKLKTRNTQPRTPVNTRDMRPEELLDSVLNALPPAPRIGASRSRSRRVSTSTLRGGEQAPPTTHTQTEAAQTGLAEELEITSHQRSQKK